MTKTNYSKDAELLEVEIDDFDTASFTETGSHPTGINDFRMRLPNRYDIAKFYKRNRRNRERGTWKNKSEPINFSKDFDWQITYSFPAIIRDNSTPNGSTYGAPHMTYRRLYLILCERFNGGDYFIDDYFDTIYPHTVKAEVDKELNKIKEDLLDVAGYMLEGAVATSKGKLDARRKINRGMKAKIREYESFAREWEESEGERLADLIKDDIIRSMETGELQAKCISHINDIDTTRERIKQGLDPYPVFVATKRLIEHIQLFVKIGGNKKWRTRQGILV